MRTAVNLVGDPRVLVRGPQLFTLDEDFAYEWSLDSGAIQRLLMYAGFTFDGASIPRAVHPFIGTWDLGLMPPLFHDGLYGCAGEMSKSRWIDHQVWTAEGWVDADHVWSRKQADRLFGRHMREAHVPSWRRASAYRAVRLFGHGAWHRGRLAA